MSSTAEQTESDSKFGYLDRIAKQYSPTRFPIVVTQYNIIVESASMENWFSSLYHVLAHIPNEGYSRVSTYNTISLEHFNLVCRYYTMARIKHVYSSYCRKTLDNGIPTRMCPIPKLPKSLADVLNGIGVFTCQDEGITYCPQPEAEPADENKALPACVNFPMLKKFSDLVSAAEKKSYIRTATISETIEGTAWWLLSPRNAIQNNKIAYSSPVVQVCGIIEEWTVADGLMAAIVQRKYDGSVGGCGVRWFMEPFHDVMNLRKEFNLKA